MKKAWIVKNKVLSIIKKEKEKYIISYIYYAGGIRTITSDSYHKCNFIYLFYYFIYLNK
jgi:hypothetical protein